jgi:hypothetical protein
MSRLSADLLRTFLKPWSVAIVVGTILLVALFAYGIAPRSSGPAPGQQFAVSYEYHSGFVFQFYVYGSTGQPLGGVTTAVTLLPANSSGTPPLRASATTSAEGLATVTVPSNDSNASAQFAVSGPDGYSGGYGQIAATPPGTWASSFGTFNLIYGGPDLLVPQVLLFFPGFNAPGQGAGELTMLAASSESSTPPAVLEVAKVDTNVSVYELPDGAVPAGTDVIELRLTTGAIGGELVASDSFPATSLQEIAYNQTAWGSSLDTRAEFGEFLAPVVGIGFGYVAYGKDRRTRALEPLTVLPMTKGSILVRRYFSAYPSIVITVIGATCAILYFPGPTPLQIPIQVWFVFGGAMVLEALAFLGLTLLLSQAVRSTGVAIGIPTILGFASAYSSSYGLGAFLGILSPRLSASPQGQPIPWLPTSVPSGELATYFAELGSPHGVATSDIGSFVFGIVLALTLAGTTVLFARALADLRD